jgi:hypothetical protein
MNRKISRQHANPIAKPKIFIAEKTLFFLIFLHAILK